MGNQAISAFQRSAPANVHQWFDRRIIASYRAPVSSDHWWRPRLQVRFNELMTLEEGWDGYQGQPVAVTVAKFAASLLEQICIEGMWEPALVPGSDGTMQIEWHRYGYDVEIDVLGPNNIVATRFNHHNDQEEVVAVENDVSILITWMKDLVTTRNALEAATA